MTQPNALANARSLLASLAGDVADFVSRGRRPRELTIDEKRLALDDTAAFEKVVARIQHDHMQDLKDEAVHDTLIHDIEKMEAEERVRKQDDLRTKRLELLHGRHEAALEVDGCIHDLESALDTFSELNKQISQLDRELGENDRHRASIGLVIMAIKRTLFHHSPSLWKLMGMPLPPGGGGSGRTLSETFAVEGTHDWLMKKEQPNE